MDTNEEEHDEHELLYVPEDYPPVLELIEAMQDPGKEHTNTKDEVSMKYKELRVFSKKLHNLLATRKIAALDVNQTRGTDRIINIIVTLRKKHMISNVHESIRQYCKSKDYNMLMVKNNVVDGGYPLILSQLSESLRSNVKTSTAMRVPNDALRVCGILLHEDYRNAVTLMMRNQKSRPSSDLPYDSNLAFCDKAVEDLTMKTLLFFHQL